MLLDHPLHKRRLAMDIEVDKVPFETEQAGNFLNVLLVVNKEYTSKLSELISSGACAVTFAILAPGHRFDPDAAEAQGKKACIAGTACRKPCLLNNVDQFVTLVITLHSPASAMPQVVGGVLRFVLCPIHVATKARRYGNPIDHAREPSKSPCLFVGGIHTNNTLVSGRVSLLGWDIVTWWRWWD